MVNFFYNLFIFWVRYLAPVGLWLAVMTMPAMAFRWRTAKDSTGVGRSESNT